MKKICILITICLILGVGCDNKVHYWEFVQKSNQVKEFKIVDSKDNGNPPKVIGVLDIELIDEFYTDISTLKMKRYGTNLSAPYGLCFMVIFENDDYDIIAHKEPKHVKYENGEYIHYNSWLCCDQEDFDELINKYLEFLNEDMITQPTDDHPNGLVPHY